MDNHISPPSALFGKSIVAGLVTAVVCLTPTAPSQVQAAESALACHPHAGWADSDGDNIPDIIETSEDLDGDGIPNYLDEDSDGDGLPDASEAWALHALSYQDLNADGIDDTYDAGDSPDPEGDGVANERLPVDSDNDGIANFLDLDSDNDGLLDSEEINTLSSVTDADTDNDGLSDKEELTHGTAANNWDSDLGGVSDAFELKFGSDPLSAGDDQTLGGLLDADNDGIANAIEGFSDADLDTIPDALDIDSDNDGWFDISEAGLVDANNDGLVDDPIDADNNGMIDSVENVVLQLPDFDFDGVADQRDLDSDNDGLTDREELGDPTILKTAGLDPKDADGDGQPNRTDLDSDGDGAYDITEAGYFDGDFDGIVDLMKDSDQDGLVDSIDSDIQNTQADTDSDGIADQFDTDHSNETVVSTNWSTLEVETITLPNTDIDNDGIVDRHDTDHDGDGLADQMAYQTPQLQDNDGDGLSAFLDQNDESAFEAVTSGTTTDSPASAQTSVPEPSALRPVDTYQRCIETVEDNDTDGLQPEQLPEQQPDEPSPDPLELGAGTSDEQPQQELSPPTNGVAEETADAPSSSGGSGSIGWQQLLASLLVLMIRRRRIVASRP